MKSYGWTEHYVKFGIIGAKGWVFYNWARQNELSLFGSSERQTSKGYIAQEIDKIVARKNKSK